MLATHYRKNLYSYHLQNCDLYTQVTWLHFNYLFDSLLQLCAQPLTLYTNWKMVFILLTVELYLDFWPGSTMCPSTGTRPQISKSRLVWTSISIGTTQTSAFPPWWLSDTRLARVHIEYRNTLTSCVLHNVGQYLHNNVTWALLKGMVLTILLYISKLRHYTGRY